MRTRSWIAAGLAAGLLLTGCAKAKEEAKEEPKMEAPAIDLAAEEQAIRNRSAEWMNYANAKDVASIANGIFAPDAVTAYDGNVRKGTADIQAGLEKEFKDNPASVISWTTSGVKVAASGDLAYETGELYFDPDGEGKKPQTTGAFVTVWAKVDGSWRAVADAGTENVTKPKS
jgi:uncharacterized protein (TIGR02246 family)